ncbi:MAG: ABC-three component system middle component 1 [Maribacter sp.]|uniref:ABC-three component system middle component 1 n=1 Tax=Maribacter sp. TaxID=1897614 RepID=UPI0032973BBE
MKDSYHNITATFKEDFSRVVLEKRIVDLEKGKAHCLLLKIPDENFLLDNWKRITNSVALNYQNHLETSFEKWNIYLFFLMSEALEDMNLKYTIENNTFSSRKIVEEAGISAEDLIKKHVNNELTLEDNEIRTESVDYSYNPLIYNVLKDKKIKKKNILPEQLNLAYDELITKFREEEE